MTFASASFLIFFALVILVQWLIFYVLPLSGENRRNVSHVFLWIASYVFYGWWDARFLTLLLGVTLVAFFSAAPKDEKRLVQSRVRLGIGVGVHGDGTYFWAIFSILIFLWRVSVRHSASHSPQVCR